MWFIINRRTTPSFGCTLFSNFFFISYFCFHRFFFFYFEKKKTSVIFVYSQKSWLLVCVRALLLLFVFVEEEKTLGQQAKQPSMRNLTSICTWYKYMSGAYTTHRKPSIHMCIYIWSNGSSWMHHTHIAIEYVVKRRRCLRHPHIHIAHNNL